jgi:hypothetical protein
MKFVIVNAKIVHKVVILSPKEIQFWANGLCLLTLLFPCSRFKVNKPITSGGRYTITYKNKLSELKIKDTTPDDAALYKCTASNIIGNVETSANLIVHSKLLEFSENNLT